MRKLVLCEKPSVARDVARALNVPADGNGYFAGNDLVITFCIGHLVELEEPAAYVAAWKRWSFQTLPMVPERFLLRPIKGTARQWQIVRKLLASRDFYSVVNACDAGREGELIFRLCYELAGSSLPIERLWISSLTPQAIRRGFAELRPGRAYDALAAAARCRTEADWLVGLNATRAVTLWRGGQTLLSLGRVQTPTLSLLTSREREIERFVPRDYFEIEAELAADPGGAGARASSAPFIARFEWEGKRRFAAAPPAEGIVGRDQQAPPPVVESIEEKPVREPPPLLFDLGALQRTCNRRFGWSAQHTLQLAQALYERHKLLTYPRTDSRHLSNDLVPQLKKTFAALAENQTYAAFCAPFCDGNEKIGAPRRIFQDHKVTDHHAIIPTLVEQSPDRLAALSSAEQKLLDLVSRRFIGAFFPDAEFRETRAVIRVDAKKDEAPSPPRAAPPDDDFLHLSPPVPDRYVARGRVRIRAGWQEVAGFSDTPRQSSSPSSSGEREPESDDEPEAERDKAQVLPPLAEGMRLRGDFTVRAKKTRPPPRYSEASLLAAMEGAGKKLTDETLRAAMSDHGLGTPATRAAIIETLLDRGYAVRKGKLLVPTELGLELIGSLPVPGLCSAELTGQWEARLAQLSRGDDGARAFMADIVAYVHELVDAVRSAPPQPPLSPTGAGGKVDRTAPRRTAQRVGRRTSGGSGSDDTATPRRTRSGAKKTSTRRATEAPTGKATARPPAERKTAERKTAGRKTAGTKTVERKAPARKAGTRRRQEEAAPPVEIGPAIPSPGTPVEPKVLCPRCRQAHLLWGRRAWGCANFRVCALVIPYENEGRRLSEVELRRICAAQRMTDSNGAATVAGDRQLPKS
jgi:DNA topoisomerase-3